jgi:hypothetical protein
VMVLRLAVPRDLSRLGETRNAVLAELTSRSTSRRGAA